MILSSFSYKTGKWELTSFSPINSLSLLVGRNSTGKTRTIHALQNVVSFMQMKTLMIGGSNSFSVEMSFSDPSMPDFKMEYGFAVKNNNIEKEQFVVNDNILIKRTQKTAKYKSETINPPVDKLIVQVRRDKNLYPEIEQLMEWTDGVTWVSCSDINPYTIVGPSNFINPLSFSELVDSLDDASLKKVLENAALMDYHLTSISTIKFTDNIRLVNVKEKQVGEDLIDMHLSSGMLRTLYLLCFMEYIKITSKATLLLVDDLSEGLDYYRSTRLGKMVFSDCGENGLQVIASSNDAFLMDVIDLSCWQVLRRSGGKVSVINQSTYPELFRDFKMIGLSNFDFFSSDYIDKYLSPQK